MKICEMTSGPGVRIAAMTKAMTVN